MERIEDLLYCYGGHYRSEISIKKERVHHKVYAEDLRKYNRKLIDRYKRFIGCKSCGNKDIKVLEFHHKNSRHGNRNLTIKTSQGPNIIRKNIRDCLVLCANCHIIEEYNSEVGIGKKRESHNTFQGKILQ